MMAKMKVYKELNQVMRAGRIARGVIRKEQEAAGIVAAGILAAALILVVSVFINLACR
jgi:hypothetical protein